MYVYNYTDDADVYLQTGCFVKCATFVVSSYAIVVVFYNDILRTLNIFLNYEPVT